MKQKIYSLTFIPIVPVLLGISFILNLFIANISELTAEVLVIPLVTVILFTFFLSLVFALVLKNKSKGYIFSSLFIIMFFSYGEAVTLVSAIHFKIYNFFVSSHLVLLTIFSIILLVLFVIVKKLSKHVARIEKFITLIAFISILISFIGVSQAEIKRQTQMKVASPLQIPQIDFSDSDKQNFPDIYLILSEDYAAPSIYKQYFGSDISNFVTFLQNKGFYVPSQSTSNYPKSFLSITSTLNMEYLDYLSHHKHSSDQTIVTPLIDDNNVMKFLKNLGYKYYQMGSWWEPTHLDPLADDNFILENKNLGRIDDFSYAVLKSTMLSPFVNTLIPETVTTESNTDKRNRIVYQFEELPKVAQLPGPKFVFVHIIAPHDPYVFDANCKYIDVKQTRKKTEVENYVNQTICINQKLENVITSIIDHSPKPPVILFLTDEGAPFLKGYLKSEDSWKDASADLLREKFPIISAYYLPGKSTKSLYPEITPVNAFRAIFNLYFSAKFPMLPDRNYIFPDMKHLYEFKDVTDTVKLTKILY